MFDEQKMPTDDFQMKLPQGEIEEFLDKLNKTLPALVDRTTASKAFDGLLTVRAMANADNKGQGPKGRRKIGRKVVYERDSFLEWIKTILHVK